jgi:putative cell wall-binding protein
MRSPEYVKCRACQAEVTPGGQFCPRCGASLWDQGYKQDGHSRIGRILRKTVFRLVVVAIFAGALLGLWYAAKHYVMPRLHPKVIAASVTTVTTLPASTTSTTSRKDQVLIGPDRYETAIAISKQGYPTTAPAVVLASGENFTDLLCGAPLAQTYGGPLLFVPPDGLYSSLKTELTRLHPAQAFLIGSGFTADVSSQLKALLPSVKVTRISGGDQYQTAAAIAEQMKQKLGTVKKVVVAPDDNIGEGLAVASLAANQGWPILLTPQKGALPKATTREITKLKVDSALVVGNIAGKVDLAKVDVKAGTDIYETSALLAQYGSTLGLNFSHVVLATGESYPDAIAAAPYAAIDNGVLLLTDNGTVPTPIFALLTSNGFKITRIDFISLPGLAKQLGPLTAGATSTTTATTAPSTTTSGT